MADQEIKIYKSGIHNLLDAEIIPKDAAQESNNWYTVNGRISLINGKVILGAAGLVGAVTGEIFGYKADGTKVHWRKIGTKIQYLNGTTWTDVITGLTSSADYSFANYSSLAGTFTFAAGVDGIFKMHNANPGSYLAMYSLTKNFKGKILIDKGRMILWDRPEDKTGLYGSYIDVQNSTVYTAVTGEATLASAGRLKIKGGIFTVTIASPGVFSKTAHGFVAGDRLRFTTTGALPTGLTAGTDYYVIAAGLTADAFEVSLTSGGAAVNTSGSQSGVHSVLRMDTRNVFAIQITLSGTGEVFTDNFVGVLTGSLGSTGTINYITGDYTLSVGGTGTVNYQWEDSNVHSLTDFTKSSTRLAGEGFQFPQDEGGDAILTVLVGSNGYYSIKSQSAYLLQIGPTDLATGTTNEVYRKELGIQSWRGAVSTGSGILFMNLAKPEKPELVILEKNLVSEDLVPKVLFPQFRFSDYEYDDCTIEVYERYVVIACKTAGAVNNDTILLGDIANGTVDVTTYSARTFARNDGNLYMGSSVTQSVYQLYNGFDDDGDTITNLWIGKDETWQTNKLKKYRKLRLKGQIAPAQSYEVYIDYDGAGFQLVGTVSGAGSYVDYNSPQSIGSNMIGEAQIGGDSLVNVYPYFLEIRLKKVPKFRKRTIKFVALSVGYVDIDSHMDLFIDVFENKIPSRFRQKQNVNLAGTTTDNANPEF